MESTTGSDDRVSPGTPIGSGTVDAMTTTTPLEVHEFYADPENRVADGPGRSRATKSLSTHVPIRFSPDAVAKVRQYAESDRKSVSSWIRDVVAAEVDLRRSRDAAFGESHTTAAAFDTMWESAESVETLTALLQPLIESSVNNAVAGHFARLDREVDAVPAAVESAVMSDLRQASISGEEISAQVAAVVRELFNPVTFASLIRAQLQSGINAALNPQEFARAVVRELSEEFATAVRPVWSSPGDPGNFSQVASKTSTEGDVC